MNILIVDDDSIAQFIIKKNLLHGGIEDAIEMAENGKDALEIFKNKGMPKILLLDLNMPVMNGFLLLEEMKVNNLITETYIITSSTLESDRKRCESFDFVKGFIEKPFSLDQVELIKERLVQLSALKKV